MAQFDDNIPGLFESRFDSKFLQCPHHWFFSTAFFQNFQYSYYFQCYSIISRFRIYGFFPKMTKSNAKKKIDKVENKIQQITNSDEEIMKR